MMSSNFLVTQFLLAETNLRNKRGETALIINSVLRRLDNVAFLMDYEAGASDANGNTCFSQLTKHYLTLK